MAQSSLDEAARVSDPQNWLRGKAGFLPRLSRVAWVSLSMHRFQLRTETLRGGIAACFPGEDTEAERLGSLPAGSDEKTGLSSFRTTSSVTTSSLSP